tara:strand:+ start:291 stop:518 length:228 start_codon:yes stop_codon:yes gene_type:complete
MNMDKLDATVKGVIATAIVGLYIWVFNTNAKNDVRDLRITHVENGHTEVLSVVKDNTRAMNNLRVVIESLKPKKE